MNIPERTETENRKRKIKEASRDLSNPTATRGRITGEVESRI